MDLLFYLIIWIGKAILKAWRARQEQPRTRRPGPPRAEVPARQPSAPVPTPTPTTPLPASGRIAALVEGAADQEARLAELEARFGRLGPRGVVFVGVLAEHLRPQVAEAVVTLRSSRDETDGTTRRAARVLDTLPAQLDLLTKMARWREDPSMGGLLADADAIAAALWQPLQDFASRHDLSVPTERPVTAPATGHEALWPDLLPSHTPLITVPDDYEGDLYRQASVAHEIAHLVWLRVPDLARQTAEAMGLERTPDLLLFDRGRLHGSLEQPLSAWLEEIFCDAMTVALLGPSGLRGLVHSFATPEDPDAVTIALADRHRRYAAHPPPHLRVHMAARTLGRMGFDAEATSLLADWDRLHEQPTSLVLPCVGGVHVRVPQELLLDDIAPRLEAWYDAELPALAGFRIESVPGWMMTPGAWARVRQLAADLVADRAFHADGRMVLAAAIEARRIAPDRAPRIAAGLRRAILGRDAAERRAADPNFARRHATGRDHPLAAEVRDALLLREILGPPAFRRRHARAGLG